MEISKKILKFIIFIVIGIFILQLLNYIFVPKLIDEMDPATARIRGFYNEKKNTIDALFLGNSEFSRGISPIKIWNEYGITSYNYGSSLQTMQVSYYKLKECLKYQTPQVVVMEVNSFFDEETTEEAYRRVIDNWRLDDVKIATIFNKDIQLDNKISYVFPILRYHSRWNELKDNDFKSSKEKYKSVSYKGMPMIVKKNGYTGNKNYMENRNKKAIIPEQNLVYIEKIIDLCQKKNIKIIMTELPSPIVWSLDKNISVTEFANEHNIQFIDFNLMEKEIELNWSDDTYDKGGHLNVYGAEKVSNYIGKVLSEEYNLPDHRNDKKIADDWNETAKRYEKRKAQLEKNLQIIKNK